MSVSRILITLTIGVTVGISSLANNTNTLAAVQPTPPGVKSLQDADNALFNGDYPLALKLYSAAVSNPQLKCDALYGLGVVNLRDQQPSDAETAFTRTLQACKPTFETYLLRADARRTLKDNDSALADYVAALKLHPGLIDSNIYERMASISGDQGLKYLRLAAEAPGAPSLQLDLHKRLVQVYTALNDTDNLVKQYEAILSLSDQPDDLANAQVALSDINFASHQDDSAYKRLQEVITKYPQTKSAFSALVTLISDDQPVDLVVRTRINIQNGNYLPVISRVGAYLTSTSTDKVPAELYVLLGKAYRGQNQLDNALATFQKGQDLYPKDPIASVAALEQAETYVLKKDDAAILAGYMKVVSTYPHSPEASEALSRAANFEQTAGHTDQAIILFEQLGTSYPQSDQAKQGLFQAGDLLATTDPQHAAALYGMMNNAQGLIWQGKLLQQLGDISGARDAWKRATVLEPDSFFGLRAADLLAGTEPYQALPELDCCAESQADQTFAEAWLRKLFKLPVVSTELSPDLAKNPSLVRGTELFRLGWWQEANSEFDALHATIRDNPLALYQLAQHYKDLRIYRSSLISATRLMIISNVPFTQVPAYLARLAYPLDYADMLLSDSNINHLDPLLVASLIRTESNFDPSVVSSADARGLMQIVDATGQQIADELKLATFGSYDLFRPSISLQLGTTYIRDIKGQLNNNSAAAVIAYNAGPYYAQALLQQAGSNFEKLYQSVDVEETRQYIEFTYQTYVMYRLLYGAATF